MTGNDDVDLFAPAPPPRDLYAEVDALNVALRAAESLVRDDAEGLARDQATQLRRAGNLEATRHLPNVAKAAASLLLYYPFEGNVVLRDMSEGSLNRVTQLLAELLPEDGRAFAVGLSMLDRAHRPGGGSTDVMPRSLGEALAQYPEAAATGADLRGHGDDPELGARRVLHLALAICQSERVDAVEAVRNLLAVISATSPSQLVTAARPAPEVRQLVTRLTWQVRHDLPELEGFPLLGSPEAWESLRDLMRVPDYPMDQVTATLRRDAWSAAGRAAARLAGHQFPAANFELSEALSVPVPVADAVELLRVRGDRALAQALLPLTLVRDAVLDRADSSPAAVTRLLRRLLHHDGTLRRPTDTEWDTMQRETMTPVRDATLSPGVGVPRLAALLSLASEGPDTAEPYLVQARMTNGAIGWPGRGVAVAVRQALNCFDAEKPQTALVVALEALKASPLPQRNPSLRVRTAGHFGARIDPNAGRPAQR